MLHILGDDGCGQVLIFSSNGVVFGTGGGGGDGCAGDVGNCNAVAGCDSRAVMVAKL